MGEELTGFSEYLVIFIDMLGSQSRTDFHETFEINKTFHERFEKNQHNDMSHTVYFRKVYTFSDCAYIFYGFKNGISDERKDWGKLFTVALCNCEPLLLYLLNKQIVFRGGISYGNAYIDHKRSMFFGEAVNKAYQLESKKAIHPRILVDSAVAKSILDNIEQAKLRMSTQNPAFMPYIASGLIPEMPELGDGIVEKDLDGQYILNYLHFPENNIIFQECYDSCQAFLDEVISFCHEKIRANTDYKIIDKYFYLLRFAEAKRDKLLGL